MCIDPRDVCESACERECTSPTLFGSTLLPSLGESASIDSQKQAVLEQTHTANPAISRHILTRFQNFTCRRIPIAFKTKRQCRHIKTCLQPHSALTQRGRHARLHELTKRPLSGCRCFWGLHLHGVLLHFCFWLSSGLRGLCLCRGRADLALLRLSCPTLFRWRL